MKTVKRLIASVSAGFEGFVDQVENHAAVADAAIRQVRANAASLKVRLARTKDSLARLQRQRGEELAQAERWRERGLRVAALDEARALHCAARFREAMDAAARLERRVAEHGAVAERMQRDLRGIEERMAEMELRKTLLISRDASAHSGQLAAVAAQDGIEEVFERWEMRVAEHEYAQPCSAAEADPVASSFDAEEDDLELRRQLAEWRDAAAAPSAAADRDDNGR